MITEQIAKKRLEELRIKIRENRINWLPERVENYISELQYLLKYIDENDVELLELIQEKSQQSNIKTYNMTDEKISKLVGIACAYTHVHEAAVKIGKAISDLEFEVKYYPYLNDILSIEQVEIIEKTKFIMKGLESKTLGHSAIFKFEELQKKETEQVI